MRGSKHFLLKACIAAVSIMALGSSVQAASITVVNASFESPVQLAGGYTTGVITDGWLFSSVSGVWFPSAANGLVFSPLGYSQIDGNQVGYSNGGTISQTLGVALQANTTYTLSLEVGDRLDLNNSGTTFSYGLYDLTTNTLLAGAANVTEATGFLAGTLKGTFVTESVAFTSDNTGVGDSLAILLSASTQQYDFDNVALDATSAIAAGASVVPAPASAWSGMALLGGLGLFGGMKRLRRQEA